MRPADAYLALGSNMGDRLDNLGRALGALPPDFDVRAVSRVYETEPAYVEDQPRFYNLVCHATTYLSPLASLHSLKALEAKLGRVTGPRFGPRLIDLDLLLYDDFQLDTPELTLPHPRLAERAFVLVPLAEVAPDVVHPVLGLPARTLRDRLGDTSGQLWLAPGQLRPASP
jgi:2-amino-4-hydroxy-6-hydroxymethyldihydropteridine diphosphokinase